MKKIEKSGAPPQEWFEMPDLRRRRLAAAVWVPLRSTETIQEVGTRNRPGYVEEIFFAASVAFPLANRAEAEKLGWMDIGIRHSGGPYPPRDLGFELVGYRGATDTLSLRSSSRHSGLGALGYFLCLLLGQRRQQGQQDISHKLVIGGQMRLGVAVEANTIGSEPLQMQDSRHHTFAGEAVERPEQHAIELALVGILEQGCELLAPAGRREEKLRELGGRCCSAKLLLP